MGNPEYPATHTKNDLLFDLDSGRLRTPLKYEIVAQSAEEAQDIQNAPAISMGQYLIESDQVKLLTTISIYTQQDESRDQVRLLYMNDAALLIWKANNEYDCSTQDNMDDQSR
jgi:hypothetical protein